MNLNDIHQCKAVIDYAYAKSISLLQFILALIDRLSVPHYQLLTKFFVLLAAVIGAISVLFKTSREFNKNRLIAREKHALNFEYQMSRDSAYKASAGVVLSILSPAIKGSKKIKLESGAIYLMPSVLDIYSSYRTFVRQNEARKHLTDVLNRWEMCANGIKSGLIDELYTYKIHATTVILLYDNLYFYIKVRQIVASRAFVNFEWLANKWKLERISCGEMEKENKDAFVEINKFKGKLSRRKHGILSIKRLKAKLGIR